MVNRIEEFAGLFRILCLEGLPAARSGAVRRAQAQRSRAGWQDITDSWDPSNSYGSYAQVFSLDKRCFDGRTRQFRGTVAPTWQKTFVIGQMRGSIFYILAVKVENAVTLMHRATAHFNPPHL